jgi:uncharacterized protein
MAEPPGIPATEFLDYAPGVRVLKNVRIPMRDGTRLAADLYMPIDPVGPLPVVMEYIPYRKDEVPRGQRLYSYLPQHGYIVARVDIRGTGASEGTVADEYVPSEQRDGYDAIEWLARQRFCDGNVNMTGISYGGFTSLQVATLQPPHLRTIVPMYFTDDRYTDDCHYRGGLLRQYYDVSYYGNFMIAYNALPPDPRWSTDWADVWREHLQNNEPYLLKWLEHQIDGEYWRQGSVGDVADQIACPTYLIGGWRDGYPNPPLRLYRTLDVPKKVLIGPWNHAVPDAAVPGPRIDYLHELVRWFDYWCKDRDTGIMEEPPVVVYMQHYERPDADRLDAPGEWRGEQSWPTPGGSDLTLFAAGDGALAGDLPNVDGEDRFEYFAHVGTTSGLWSGGLQFGQPSDQRPDEAWSLLYTTAPVDQPVYIIGRPRLQLFVSSTAKVIGFAVTLSDVAPDGSSHLVAKGVLNATRRDSLITPSPLTPNHIYELSIDVDATAWRFAAGHRIRVAIASADWPNVWPTPDPAINTVFRGPIHPTRLVLPIVDSVGSATPPSFVPSPASVERHSQRPEPPVWEITHDAFTRRSFARFVDRSATRVSSDCVVSREHAFVAEVDTDNPGMARAHGRHISSIRRGIGLTEARSDVMIQGTPTHLHVTLTLCVDVNGARHFTRQWSRSINRHLL